MFDIEDIRNSIVKGIYEYTSLPVVPTNDENRRPKTPYHTYNFITPYSPRSSPITWTTEEKDEYNLKSVRGELPSITLSMNTHSKSQSDMKCLKENLKLREWFFHEGAEMLKGKGIVITEVGAAQDRTILQSETEYQHRIGFDVRMRVINKTERVIGIIEKVEYIIGEVKE